MNKIYHQQRLGFTPFGEDFCGIKIWLFVFIWKKLKFALKIGASNTNRSNSNGHAAEATLTEILYLLAGPFGHSN